jgi:hypothetical protein
VSFLGTKQLRDLLTDLRFWLSPFPDALSGPGDDAAPAADGGAPAVHSGFLARAQGVASEVQALYARAGAEGRDMVLCGHSLGAAVAMLATLQLLGADSGAAGRVRCVGFAAPAVGNAALAALVLRSGWEGLFELHSTPEDQVIGFINTLLVRGRRRQKAAAAAATASAGTSSSGPGRAAHVVPQQLLGPASDAASSMAAQGLLASSKGPGRMAVRPRRLQVAGLGPIGPPAAPLLKYGSSSNSGNNSSSSGSSSGNRTSRRPGLLDLASSAQPLLGIARLDRTGGPFKGGGSHAAPVDAASRTQLLPGMLLLWLLTARRLASGTLRLLPCLLDSWAPAYHAFGVQFHVTSSGLRQLSCAAAATTHSAPPHLVAGRRQAAGQPLELGRQQQQVIRGLVGAAAARGRRLASLLMGLHPGKLRQLYWQHRMLAYRARISQVAGSSRGL